MPSTYFGTSSSGKTTAFGAVIPLVRIQPSQIYKKIVTYK